MAEEHLKERWLVARGARQGKPTGEEFCPGIARGAHVQSEDGTGERWRSQPPRDSPGTNPRAHRDNVASRTSRTGSERDGSSSSVSIGTVQVTQQRAQQEEEQERARSGRRSLPSRKEGRRPRPQHRLRRTRLKPCRGPDGMACEDERAGHGRRRDDRESCAGISPGWTWTWLLIWIAIVFIVRMHQQWDPTLGFPVEGPSNAPEGWRRTSAPEGGTCLCGKPYLRKNTGDLHVSGFFACRKHA